MNAKEVFEPDSSILVGAAESVWAGSSAIVTIQISVTENLRAAMEAHGIIPLETVFITDSDIRHIKRHHAANERERGQLEITPSDFAYIPQVLNEFDACEESEPDKLGNKRFLLVKTINDVFYVVTVQRGKRKLEIKTMWKRPGASC